jgi:ABC-2 type transport system ATP-binding protein
MADAPPVEVRALTKRYGSTVAVDGLNFAIAAGRITGFLGPNGAGKTSTLRALLGLVRPTSGEALVEGQPYARLRDPLGTVGAGPRVGELPSRALRAEPSARARDRRRRPGGARGRGARAGRAHRRGPPPASAGYSLGMRQRLSVAGALLGWPRLLVLDEPANGLDPEGIRWLREFLRSFAAGGGTVLISSHVLAEVAQLADEVVIIHRGRLVTQEPLARSRHAPAAGPSCAVRTTSASRRAAARADRGVGGRGPAAGGGAGRAGRARSPQQQASSCTSSAPRARAWRKSSSS